ncbi:MAG: hypothetical protein KDE47_09925, partial [Caldilineaceae bacterium]|nr:hypothetical protein [Caldilineaceae bacterium]
TALRIQHPSAHPVNRPPAIIIGLDSLPGIQAARILAAHAVPVIAIAARPAHYCCKTNVCQQILFADTQSSDFIQTLCALGPTLPQKGVLIPCSDMSVWHISTHRDLLHPYYHVLLPPHPTLAMLLDKVAFYTYAQQQALPIAPTRFLHSRADAERAAAAMPFPCVLKPPKRTPAWTRQTHHKVYQVASADQLLPLYDQCAQWTSPLILQQWVAGPESNLYSCNCYFNAEGESLVDFTARKLRQWPPGAGSSSLGEACINDTVRNVALTLFRRVGYHGLGYMELKQDAISGDYFIMEVNVGRPTVRSAIAEAGGVALHYAAYCSAIGAPLPPNLQQSGQPVKWVHLHYDARSAFHYWRRGELTLRDWLRSWRGIGGYAVWSRRDPAPFFCDIVTTIGRGIGKR